MPLFQNESSCKTFHMKMHECGLHIDEPGGGTHFHMNGFAWRLVLRQRQKEKDTVLGNNWVMSIFQFVVNEVLGWKGGKFFARWSLYELNETRRCGKSEQNRVFLYFPCTFSSKVVHILRNCDQWERLKPGDLNYSIVEQPHSQEKPRARGWLLKVMRRVPVEWSNSGVYLLTRSSSLRLCQESIKSITVVSKDKGTSRKWLLVAVFSL